MRTAFLDGNVECIFISNENVSCFQKNTYMYQHIGKMTRAKDAFLWHFPETSVAPRATTRYGKTICAFGSAALAANGCNWHMTCVAGMHVGMSVRQGVYRRRLIRTNREEVAS